MQHKPSSGWLIVSVFSAALLVSAALLFSIQPIIGKQLLPRVGGAPQVWNVAMAFFQIALLAGYIIAHGLSRLSIRMHTAAYILLLILAAIFLPIALPDTWQPDITSSLSLAVLSILVSTVAVPFVALSLSAPTLQRLFSGTQHKQATDPYFLYAASNFGSFTGLMAYLFFLEPMLTLSQQAEVWHYGFFTLIALAVACLELQIHSTNKQPVTSQQSIATAPTWKQRAKWVLLSFIPSSLTLGVTTYIGTDLTPVPLLWVVTLGLYLLSFIVAFATRGLKLREYCLSVYPWLAGFSAVVVFIHINLPWPVIFVCLLAFFTTAVACHSMLANTRPHASRLTDFYLWISVGGALGGSFNAFIAPLIFSQLTEYPLVLLLGILVAGSNALLLSDTRKVVNLSAVLISLSVTNLLMFYSKSYLPDDLRNIVLAAFLASTIPLLRIKQVGIYGAAAVFLIVFALRPYFNDSIFITRNFFGTVSVNNQLSDDGQLTYRQLAHGTTTHGMQLVAPQRSVIPTGYYAPTTPLSLAWQINQPKAIAIIGLGAGTLNCTAKPGQDIHFIEIDPTIISIAKEYFTFLSECPPPRITLGDGRIVMTADTAKYDMIVLDAFSSDSIPMHLITQEAIALYLSRLNQGGIIAIHTSNRFFNLQPVIAAIAHNLKITGYVGRNYDYGVINGAITFPSEAIVLATDALTLKPLDGHPDIWEKIQPDTAVQAWTDNYSNILSAIKSNSWLAPSSVVSK